MTHRLTFVTCLSTFAGLFTFFLTLFGSLRPSPKEGLWNLAVETSEPSLFLAIFFKESTFSYIYWL